jgi:leader peptidase (prepilin peptidase) / N-methyltransferase
MHLIGTVFEVVLLNAAFTGVAVVGARRSLVRFEMRRRDAAVVLAAGVAVQCLLAAYDSLPLPLMIVAAAVCVSALTDALTGYVFDTVSITAGVMLLAIAWVLHQLPSAVEGAAVAGGAMFLLYALTLGRGIGLGDAKLACCIGAGLGALPALVSIGAAFVFGGVYAAFLLITRRGSRGDEVRFAPYMAAGVAAWSLYGMPR